MAERSDSRDRAGKSRGNDRSPRDRDRGNSRSGGDRDRRPSGDKGRYSKPGGDRDRRPSGDRDRYSRPGGDRDRRPSGDRSRDSRPGGDRDRRPSGDRDRRPAIDRERSPFRGKRFGEGDGKPFGDKKPKAAKTTPTGNVIKIWREGFSDQPEQQEEKPDFRAKPGVDDRKRPSGKKLWVKGKNHSKTGDAPPAGHDKHKDVTSYYVEEQERMHAERQKRRIERRKRAMTAKPAPAPTSDSTENPLSASSILPETAESEIYEPDVEVIYTVGFAGLSVQKLLQKLVDVEVNIAIDLRTDEIMLSPGFSKARDLAILFKEAAGIEYRREDILTPRREICSTFINDRNWLRFTKSYQSQLARMKVEMTLNRKMFSVNKVALLGDKSNFEKDHRSIVAEYLKEAWHVTSVINL